MAFPTMLRRQRVADRVTPPYRVLIEKAARKQLAGVAAPSDILKTAGNRRACSACSACHVGFSPARGRQIFFLEVAVSG